MKRLLATLALATVVSSPPARAATITFVDDSFAATASASSCRTPLGPDGNPIGPMVCTTDSDSYADSLIGVPPIAFDAGAAFAFASVSAAWDSGALRADAGAAGRIGPMLDPGAPTIASCPEGTCRYSGQTARAFASWTARFLVAGDGASVTGRYSWMFGIRSLDDPSWSLMVRWNDLPPFDALYTGALISGHEYLVSGVAMSQDVPAGSRFPGTQFTLGFVGVDRVAVPEPGTLMLLGIGLVGIGLALRRRAESRPSSPARPPSPAG